MKFLFLFFFLSSLACAGQDLPIASRATDVKWADTTFAPGVLSAQLTKDCLSDSQKVASIFGWITGNISYDTKGYYNLNSIYKGLFRWTNGQDSLTAYSNYNDNIVEKVLREKVAICDGYTRLFKTLCDHANIRSEIILGYVRWHTDTIGNETKRIHAWNAVEIDGKWQLADPTWASGFSNAQVTTFQRDYDPYYFLTPPRQMINDHFPLDDRWQLLPTPVSLSQFYNQPYFFPGFVKHQIKSFSPSEGVLEAAAGEKVLFKLEAEHPEQQLVVLTSLMTDSSVFASPVNRVSADTIFYKYQIPAAEVRQLYLVYKGELLMKYELRAKPNLTNKVQE